MEKFTVSSCPVCDNWTVQCPEDTLVEVLEDVLRDHMFECFGVSELMSDLPWSA